MSSKTRDRSNRSKYQEVVIPGETDNDLPRLVRTPLNIRTLKRRTREVDRKILDRIRNLTDTMGIDFDAIEDYVEDDI